MKKVIFAAMALVAFSAQSAFAGFTWDIIPSTGDEIEVKLKNWESTITAVGNKLFGVGRITSIGNITTGDVAWQESTVKELTVVFNDFTAADIFPLVSGDSQISFTGGVMKIFFDDTRDTTLSDYQLAGTNAAPDASGNFSNGTEILRLTGAAGGFLDDAGTVFNETTATLQSTVSQLAAGAGFSGDGTAFLDADLTSFLGPYFNSNLYGGAAAADARFASTLQPPKTAGVPTLIPGYYDVVSNDPVNLTIVPEPASMLIWSLGGLGVAAVRVIRRRKVA